jgi:hypothetical protein
MIRGLHVAIRGEELSERIGERIRIHEATINALDVRLKQREGDQPFDVRGEDGFKTLSELQDERQHYRDRVLLLTLVRDTLAPGELYALSGADLRLAELISPDFKGASEISGAGCVHAVNNATIDGLRLAIRGQELRSLLEQRIHRHQERAEWWKQEQARTPDQQTEEEPLLPDHMCANESERHGWRADVLGFIRDHIDSADTYRLGEADLAFGELLPEKPAWMEQEEYEDRTSVGFNLERLTKSIGEPMFRTLSVAARHADADE